MNSDCFYFSDHLHLTKIVNEKPKLRTIVSISLLSLAFTSTLYAEVVDATVKVINNTTRSFDVKVKTPLSVDITKNRYASFNVESFFLPAQTQAIDWQSIDPIVVNTKIYIDDELQTPYIFILKSVRTGENNTKITTQSTIKLSFSRPITQLSCTVFDKDNDQSGVTLDCRPS
ncbi:MAG: hypothetical protein VXY77_02755 [Pseudomonadota bacterium]|nr:hypothetical protein [Pseudomonadota bacterium]